MQVMRRLLISLGVIAPSVALAGSIPRTTLKMPTSTVEQPSIPEAISSPEFAIVQNYTRMNVDICKALGLDPLKVRGVTISLLPQQAALVTVQHILTNEQMRVVGQAVKRYKIVPMDA